MIPGAIIQIGNLDDAIDVTTWNNSSKQIEVTLDDTDGSIKALFDSTTSPSARSASTSGSPVLPGATGS